ncbi:MAG: hypothetical protein WB502_05185 [Thermoactinomyces sp.]
MNKILLRLGKETFGNKDIHETFHEAFAPYFAGKEKTNQVKLLKTWKNLSGKNWAKSKDYAISEEELGT